MISCDECQKKLVASLDNEGTKGDERLISAHLGDCSDCRAFREDILRIRREFVPAPMPEVPEALREALVRAVEADGLGSERSALQKRMRREPSRRWFRRLAWAAGVAALLLLALSWLICFNLANQVADLKHQLQTAERDLALLREQRRLEESQRQLAKAQERQGTAISAIDVRIRELEERPGRFPSLWTISYPPDMYALRQPGDGL